MNPHQTRQLLAEIGISDDRQERALLEMFAEKDAKLELERAKVPDEVWRLEDRLMEAMK